MIDVRRWNWELDKPGMVCSNDENKVIVKIIQEEKGIRGKIVDISMELHRVLAHLKNGPNIVQQIAFEAENEYLRAQNY